MGLNLTLYAKVIDLSSDYLGPAADRFINRQIHNHLDIKPESLSKDDLKQLLAWIKLSMSILTNDNQLIAEYIKSLKSLAKQ